MNKCADLFANTSEGLRWMNFEKIKSDMSNKGIDLDDKKACRQYIKEKYNFKL